MTRWRGGWAAPRQAIACGVARCLTEFMVALLQHAAAQSAPCQQCSWQHYRQCIEPPCVR